MVKSLGGFREKVGRVAGEEGKGERKIKEDAIEKRGCMGEESHIHGRERLRVKWVT